MKNAVPTVLLYGAFAGGAYLVGRKLGGQARAAPSPKPNEDLARVAQDPQARPSELTAAAREATQRGFAEAAQALRDAATRSTVPESAPSACERWSTRARDTARHPSGNPVTDDEMNQLLSTPRFLIPGSIERAVDRWAAELGPPPAGCDTVWARRWKAWTR